jgi:hypothetical protein
MAAVVANTQSPELLRLTQGSFDDPAALSVVLSTNTILAKKYLGAMDVGSFVAGTETG